MNCTAKSDLLGGMRIDSVDSIEVEEILVNEVNKQTKNHISITNTEAMYFGANYQEHYDYINTSKLSLCDGVGVVLAAKVHGIKIKRYHGPDFFMDTIRNGQKYGWTHYFLGGKEGVGVNLKEKIHSEYPSVEIVGMYSPPFRELNEEEKKEMIDKINRSNPNFLWVSLGLPKQERWIMEFKKSISANFIIGVGAAFDFHTDNIKRAPLFCQKIGLEWLYRVCFERRLIPRILDSFKLMFGIMISNKKRF